MGGCATDPAGTEDCHLYRYCPLNDSTGFVLTVNLESSPTPALSNHAICTTGGPNWYWLEVL